MKNATTQYSQNVNVCGPYGNYCLDNVNVCGPYSNYCLNNVNVCGPYSNYCLFYVNVCGPYSNYCLVNINICGSYSNYYLANANAYSPYSTFFLQALQLHCLKFLAFSVTSINSTLDVFCPIIYFHGLHVSFYVVLLSSVWYSC